MSHAVRIPTALSHPVWVGDGGRPAVLAALIADPDEDSTQELALALLEHGVQVTTCGDGGEALLQTGLTDPDVLLVSATMPVIDGSTLIGVLRKRRDTPVIVGIGPDDSAEAARALAAGATACVPKPYRIPQLLPMLQAVRPDLAVTALPILRCGPLELDDVAHEVRLRQEPIHLPPREFELLRYLMRHQDRVLGQREILTHVWGTGHSGDPSTVTVHIKRLRGRLGDDNIDTGMIQTIRGLGYRIRPCG